MPERSIDSGDSQDEALPVVCLITADEDFIGGIEPELAPWYQVAHRNHYGDTAIWVREQRAQAVLVDIDTQGEEAHAGVKVLRELRILDRGLVLISLSRSRARGVEKLAVEAGSDAHFHSPIDLSELRLVLKTTLEVRIEETERARMQQQVLERSTFQDLVGASESMRRVYDAITQVADSRINVLIRGESGTGKELVARAIVALSSRRKKAFISLNCAALPENLIESELFGHERGAFTGANEAKPGQIELADGGTLFLDEIATLTLPLQTKLLRVLEDRQVQRLGGRQSRKIDFRLICATNEPLEEMVRSGKFREDLYYRIHVVPIQLPPLRERMGDIPLLVDYFLRIHLTANGQGQKRFTVDALAALEEHRWPGNVRELENLIQRLVVTVTGETVGLEHLPQQLLAQSVTAHEAILLPQGGVRFDDEIRELEVALLEAALRRSNGSKAAAARLLHLDSQRMKYLCRKYSL
ncbi:MAG TPA: sigma-54 dependent transcriptional regulator [Acidobacteriaceae bacterium]|nr:sigma-54 dependent transcriptional regulator [Acidobacteriaceae bacterium]